MKQKMVKAWRYQWNWQKLSKLLSEELFWLFSFVIKMNLFPASDAFPSGTLFMVLHMSHRWYIPRIIIYFHVKWAIWCYMDHIKGLIKCLFEKVIRTFPKWRFCIFILSEIFFLFRRFFAITAFSMHALLRPPPLFLILKDYVKTLHLNFFWNKSY